MMTRNEVENIIKEYNLDRNRIFEVSYLKYASLIRKIEDVFVEDGGAIHWANLNGRFKTIWNVKRIYVGYKWNWYQKLIEFISAQELLYVMLEEKRQRPKYWVYEMDINHFIKIMDEGCFGDFYIVSKKFEWMISEDHEETVCFVGKDVSKFEQLIAKI